jgi:uncharacterized protein YqgC (DUF456 family)
MDVALIAAAALLVAGVVGSVLPLVPGPLLSAAAVAGYWWDTGYGEPGAVFVAAVVTVTVLAVAADWFGGAVAARAGGADAATSAAAAVLGIVLMLVAGPVGLLVGIAGTVFVVEIVRGATGREGARAAGYAVVGTVGSAAVQVVVTVGVLVGFVVAVLL